MHPTSASRKPDRSSDEVVHVARIDHARPTQFEQLAAQKTFDLRAVAAVELTTAVFPCRMAFGLGSFLANFASWFGMKSSNEQLPHEPAAADPAPINQEVAAADPVGPAVGPAEGHGLPEGAAAGADEVSNEEAGEEAEASSEEKKAVEEEEELQFQEAAEARFVSALPATACRLVHATCVLAALVGWNDV